jgi:hypothetical protein
VITAVDTNVLIDVFQADASHGPSSREALRSCMRQGALIACDIVWSEVVAGFPTIQAAVDALERLRVGFSALDRADAGTAGDAWRRYRARGGRRTRVVSDFLVGAHASGRADRLLTRDRGFYRQYFGSVVVLDPSQA